MSKKTAPKNPSPPEIPDKLYFRIGEVSQLVEVDTHVLRYWEKEFKLKPDRSKSGQRLYKKQDLSTFLRIKHLLHVDGYTIVGARRALTNAGKSDSNSDPTNIQEILNRLKLLRSNMSLYRDEILTTSANRFPTDTP